ncbi:ribonucleotide-diphosphate reductase subunit alpha [Bacillus phage vB_BceM-HSE3]|nr:ribonucleotide-diphosphate reductase subunit alpha [Bacillus phage vB_BceM-HSE3]
MTNYIELNNEITRVPEGKFYDLEKDHLAVAEYQKEIDANSRVFSSPVERMHQLIEENFYDPELLKQYTDAQIDELYKLAYSIPFQFNSFMAISKFYKDYALMSNDQKTYLENYQDKAVVVSMSLGKGDMDKARRFTEQIMKQNYQPATPTYLNSGRARRGELVSCFLLQVDDSLNAIGHTENVAMQLSKLGGGVAINLSKLRARGEAIKDVENAASGVVPVMKLLEDAFAYANQLGQRKGAGAAYLNIFHWDVVEFLDTKKINADEKSRIQSLSIGLITPRIFWELNERNEPLYVFAPLSVRREYGVHLDDMDLDEMYYELVNNPNVKKKEIMSTRAMVNKIAMIQLESGYPYIMFKSNANDMHTLKDAGEVKMSNLCTEIFQLQELSFIDDYKGEDIIKREVSCNLGSLNIERTMENKEIKEAVHAGMEALTEVSDSTSIRNAPGVQKANQEMHSVGLGAMNLHGYLAKNRIPYESKEALDFARTYFMMLNFYSLEKSMEIARERTEVFRDFEKSEYAKGTYFDKYLVTDYSPEFDKVKALFEGIYIPTPEDWKELKAQVQQHGLYHAYRLAIAPTQSISYVQNATSSVMPIVSQIETRTYGNATTYYPMPFLSKDTMWYYKSAYDMNQYKLLDMIATIQEHIDQGISTILYVNSDISTRELGKYYSYASMIGLKSLYYTRTRKLSIEGCIACAI